jgi:hypothetical protein
MKTEKLQGEISRLLNLASRKIRETGQPPTPQQLQGVAKLVTAYCQLLQIEEGPVQRRRDDGRGQANGYARLKAMHEELELARRRDSSDYETDEDEDG